MNSKAPKPLPQIYQLPVIGDLLCYIGYILSLLAPMDYRRSGYRQIKCGTSAIWTPKDKMEVILSGIECLKKHDADMFSRFTNKQNLSIYYSHKENTTNLYGYIFALNERYILFGAEGVAASIVQSLLISDASPSVNQFRLNEFERSSLKVAPRKTMEWMQRHSLNSDLINSYRKVVEVWEQRNIFTKR